MNNVSFIISVDNTYELVNNFFEHLLQDSFALESEIIIVLDDVNNVQVLNYINQIYKRNENIKVFHTEKRLGYGCANNFGVEQSNGDYLYFLNTDVFAEKKCFETMYFYLEKKKADCVQPLLVFPQNDRIQCAGTIFGTYYKKHLFAGRKISNIDFSSIPLERQALTSALYAMKKDIFYAYGKFDEFYFNKIESMELSLKLSLSGKRCICIPDAIAYHAQGTSRNNYYLDFTQQEAHFWSNIGSKARVDIEEYYKMQLTNDIISTVYNVISICQTRDILTTIVHIPINVWNYTEINGIDPQKINLFNLLPHTIHASNMPLLFFVENITNLSNNKKWFSSRSNNDIVMDTNGNLLFVRDI